MSQQREHAHEDTAIRAGVSAFQSAAADLISGRVVGVADGDTLTVLDGDNTPHKVRLSGIDAPEKSQPFGQRSKQSLSDLAYGRSVSVEWRKTDIDASWARCLKAGGT